MLFNGFTFWGLRKPDPLPPPDILAFMEFVRRGRFPDEYTAEERYADFRRVFMSDPVGQRVLYQIFDWGGLFATTSDEVTGDYLLRVEGRREVAAAIMAALNAEIALFGPHSESEEDRLTGESDG